jgi:hypothetical protein
MPELCGPCSDARKMPCAVDFDGDADSNPCVTPSEPLSEAICCLCQNTSNAPFGSVSNSGVCCVRCMEMAAEVLLAYSNRQVQLPDDPVWLELLEAADQFDHAEGQRAEMTPVDSDAAACSYRGVEPATSGTSAVG